MQHYKESAQWIQDNMCRNLSRAITVTLGSVNRRHLITFHYENDIRAEKRCNRIYSLLKEQNATINETCTFKPEPQLEGFLTVNELQMVRKFPMFKYILQLYHACRCAAVVVPELPTI